MFDELESSLLVNARLSTNWQSVALMPSRALPVLLSVGVGAVVPTAAHGDEFDCVDE